MFKKASSLILLILCMSQFHTVAEAAIVDILEVNPNLTDAERIAVSRSSVRVDMKSIYERTSGKELSKSKKIKKKYGNISVVEAYYWGQITNHWNKTRKNSENPNYNELNEGNQEFYPYSKAHFVEDKDLFNLELNRMSEVIQQVNQKSRHPFIHSLRGRQVVTKAEELCSQAGFEKLMGFHLDYIDAAKRKVLAPKTLQNPNETKAKGHESEQNMPSLTSLDPDLAMISDGLKSFDDAAAEVTEAYDEVVGALCGLFERPKPPSAEVVFEKVYCYTSKGNFRVGATAVKTNILGKLKGLFQ